MAGVLAWTIVFWAVSDRNGVRRACQTLEGRLILHGGADGTMSAAIAFSNIGKSFRRPHSHQLEVVLRNFNLSIATGQLVALVGPSGVGKTTLLHIAAGIETAGRRTR